ncbi:MAG: ATP-grasp domain-containing protein, partial [bacterium]|nr:ATP-grasp domain-containing protein [bacterium]
PMGEIRAACLFELLELPYTGSSPYTLAVALNKARAKEIFSFYKIPTPKFLVVKRPSEIKETGDLSFPLIVKPIAEDGSIGIDERSLAGNFGELQSALIRLHENFHSGALVEEFIDGREFHVSIWGNKKPEVLPISEVDFSGLSKDHPRILTYDSKWREHCEVYRGTPIICPAEINPVLEERIKDLVFQVYRVFECRDYARIDFRVDGKGRLHVLEVNPNPDISDDSGFRKSARAAGFGFKEIIGKIIDSAAERGEPR